MNMTHIEHIGIAVLDLEESIKKYENLLNLKCYAIEEVPDQKVITAFFRVGDTKIELIASTASDSPIAKFIEKKGEGYHHIAFAVPNTQIALDQFKEAGGDLIDEKPRPGAENLLIGFAHPKSLNGVLTEFCSPKK